jgi:hypothetical protein
MKNTDSHFASRDLYLCSLLFAKGYQLISVDFDSNGAFYWFIFDQKEKCEKEEQAFLKNQVSVKAKDFSEAIKFMKRKVSR